MAAPILYPKVVLVHHARSGQSKCLIWAGGQSRESLCHLPVRHNFWNLNHDKISAVIREVSFKVKTPFKTLKFLSLLLPIFFLNSHFTFLSTLIIEGFVLDYVAPSKVCCEFLTATWAPNESVKRMFDSFPTWQGRLLDSRSLITVQINCAKCRFKKLCRMVNLL